MMWPGFILQALFTFIYLKKDTIKKKALGITCLIVFILTMFITYITPRYLLTISEPKSYFKSVGTYLE